MYILWYLFCEVWWDCTKFLLLFSLFFFLFRPVFNFERGFNRNERKPKHKQKSNVTIRSYSDQSLEVDGIFPSVRIACIDDGDDEEEDDDDEAAAQSCDKSVSGDTMELDFNELTFN